MQKPLPYLIAATTILSAIAAASGIFSAGGPGPFTYESIRGETIDIYGRGLYQHMSAEVAIQGIAQDYVTLFLAIPLLLLASLLKRKYAIAGGIAVSGILFYFLVTYLFYTAMAMYNALFLIYVALLGCSFFALFLSLREIDLTNLQSQFSSQRLRKGIAFFLIFTASAIAVLWLSTVVPPLLDGSLYPAGLHHYTTLIVQGFDLGLLLPIAFVSGIYMYRIHPLGILAGSVYVVFLSILMTALTAKVLAMGWTGQSIFPVIFIIPTFNLTALLLSIVLLLELIKNAPNEIYKERNRD